MRIFNVGIGGLADALNLFAKKVCGVAAVLEARPAVSLIRVDVHLRSKAEGPK